MVHSRAWRPAQSRKAIFLGLSALLLLTGCFPINPISKALRGELDGDRAVGRGEVDFSTLVEGNWTRLVLVCDLNSPESVDAALGFHWDFSKEDHDSMFLFVTEDSVESYSHSGYTKQSTEPWIYPCTAPAIQSVPQLKPIVLNRDEARVTFIYDTITFGIPLWYISEPDYQVLLQSAE